MSGCGWVGVYAVYCCASRFSSVICIYGVVIFILGLKIIIPTGIIVLCPLFALRTAHAKTVESKWWVSMSLGRFFSIGIVQQQCVCTYVRNHNPYVIRGGPGKTQT